jgi:hypothetical protein
LGTATALSLFRHAAGNRSGAQAVTEQGHKHYKLPQDSHNTACNNTKYNLQKEPRNQNNQTTNNENILLGAFAKLRKETILTSRKSVCVSVCIEKLGYHWVDLHKI